jgi:hypothetical protein
MDQPWFNECYLINDDAGVELYGSSAYFVPCHRIITNQEETYCVIKNKLGNNNIIANFAVGNEEILFTGSYSECLTFLKLPWKAYSAI